MGKIRALFIYEILGKPPEHIKEALNNLINQIGKNPGIKILNKKVHKPHLIDEEKTKKLGKKVEDLYSTFAETEMEVDSLDIIFKLVVNTLPSNMEILEPSELKLKNFELSQALAEISIKLHQIDEVAKTLNLERSQLINIVKELQEKSGLEMIKFESSSQVQAGGENSGVGGKKKEEKIEDMVGEEDKDGGEGKEKDKKS